ncbi:MAG: YtxH domain-containing protein [Bacteroidota bacterium]
MSNKKGRGIAFALGALAGATVAYFLTTEEGKKWRKETAKRTREFTRRVSGQAQEQIDYISRSMETFVANNKEDIEEVVEQVSDEVKDFTEQISSSFQRGMSKAKHATKNNN